MEPVSPLGVLSIVAVPAPSVQAARISSRARSGRKGTPNVGSVSVRWVRPCGGMDPASVGVQGRVELLGLGLVDLEVGG